MQRFAICSLIALFLSMIGTANAYYNTQQGRFLTRDPQATGPRPIRIGDPINETKAGIAKTLPRFLERDSKENQKQKAIEEKYPDGLNLYQYAKSSSIVFVDPEGLFANGPCALLEYKYVTDNYTGVRGGDKFQHCMLSCLLVRSCGFNEAECLAVGTAWEIFGGTGVDSHDLAADAIGCSAGCNPLIRWPFVTQGCTVLCSIFYTLVRK